MVGEFSEVQTRLSGDSGSRSTNDPESKVGEGWDDNGWTLKTIKSSTFWSSNGYDNSRSGSLDNHSYRGEKEELGKPDGSATMTLS